MNIEEELYTNTSFIAYQLFPRKFEPATDNDLKTAYEDAMDNKVVSDKRVESLEKLANQDHSVAKNTRGNDYTPPAKLAEVREFVKKKNARSVADREEVIEIDSSTTLNDIELVNCRLKRFKSKHAQIKEFIKKIGELVETSEELEDAEDRTPQ